MKHSLIGIAILLIIIWVVARVLLAVTSLALNLLWIGAVVLAVMWLIGLVSRRT